MSVEQRLETWARWAAESESVQGYPKQSSTASIYAFKLDPEPPGEGKGLTAFGKATHSRKPLEPGEAPDGVWEVERAVSALRKEDARVWAVLVAKYLGLIPRRRERIRRDEGGDIILLYERTRQGNHEAVDAFHERLRQRLFVSRATFHNRLARAREYVAGYCEAVKKVG